VGEGGGESGRHDNGDGQGDAAAGGDAPALGRPTLRPLVTRRPVVTLPAVGDAAADAADTVLLVTRQPVVTLRLWVTRRC